MRGVPERISRFLARAGVASRRRVDGLVLEGRVRVNGRPAILGEKITPGVDEVAVDGREILVREAPVYILLNKPRGYLSTCKDPFGRRTVLSLLKDVEARVFPVGRLDVDADGLLLLTNDGDLTYLLTHPKHRVIKEYVVEVSGAKDDRKLRDILSGIIIDGKKVEVDYARFLEPRPGRSLRREAPLRGPGTADPTRLCIGVHEGEKHLVKNLCRAVGYRVTRLTRTRMGRLFLSDLPSGKWRRLADGEVAVLYGDARKGLEGDKDAERQHHFQKVPGCEGVPAGKRPAVFRESRRDPVRGYRRRLLREDKGDS